MEPTMRAVRLFAPGDVRCVETAVPKLELPDDVLVKVKACGVCGSDIPRVMVKGAYRHPITIGHEFAGEVAAACEAASGLRVGDRVTVMPLIPCGTCNYCRMGDFALCENYDYYGSRSEGAMAEYVKVKAANVLPLPENLDYESAAMTDPCSVALHGVRKLRINPGQSAAVVGLGAIGFFALQWLRALGCGEIFAVDVFPEKLALATKLGADRAIDGRSRDAADAIRELTGGSGVDFVVELAGSKATQLLAIRMAKKRGQVVLCGISYEDLTIPQLDLNRILRNELTILGSWNSSIAPLPINEWEVALRAMSSGLIRAESLVTHRFALEQCGEAFAMLHKRSEPFTKVLFIP